MEGEIQRCKNCYVGQYKYKTDIQIHNTLHTQCIMSVTVPRGCILATCGWMVVDHLWVGGTSDSHYQEHAKIFEKQEDFTKYDTADGKYVAFTNVLDEGYCVNLPA